MMIWKSQNSFNQINSNEVVVNVVKVLIVIGFDCLISQVPRLVSSSQQVISLAECI